MKFVQFSDIHLDSSGGGSANLPEEKKAILRSDLCTAFERACAVASDKKADLVLIPGDLFDNETITKETASFVAEKLGQIAPARVFITPGNHDSLKPGSPYIDTKDIKWPNNVYIFCNQEFSAFVLDDINCSITGIAHIHRGITSRLLRDKINFPQKQTNILLIHGSRDGYLPGEKENILPFSDDELLSQDFTYAAIGHYHSFAQIEDEKGKIRAAYSGCIQGRGLDETGEKCIIAGEIDSEGFVSLEKVDVSVRRFISLSVNITGCADNASIINRIETEISKSGARECDVINICLSGSLHSPDKLDISSLTLSKEYFHVNIDSSRITPDYDLDEISRSSSSFIKAEFVRAMLEREKNAIDEAERLMLRDAIYYGLYALDRRQLEPRDVD